MEGPVDNCSAGYWDGLESVGPVDTEEWESWNQAQLAQKRTQAQRERWAPMFEVLLGGGTQEDADAKLEIMVRDYGLEPAVAVEISDSVAALMKGR